MTEQSVYDVTRGCGISVRGPRGSTGQVHQHPELASETSVTKICHVEALAKTSDLPQNDNALKRIKSAYAKRLRRDAQNP